MRELRLALRGLRRAPGFAALAVLTLAVGIGASTAVFSVVDLLLFRSLPYPHADQLVSFGFSGPIDSNEFNLGKSYLEWRRQTAFESMTSMYPGTQCDLTGDSPMRIPCQEVEANFLTTLGISPALGRDFAAEDDRPGAPLVALLGYRLWRSRFGGDASVVGKTIEIDSRAVRVIGVLPETFEMPQLGEADVMVPERMNQRAARAPGATVFLRTFARLKTGISLEEARQRLTPLFEESKQKDVPPMLRNEVHLVVRSLRDRQIQDARTASWMLFGAVMALLVLACANVVNLLLARATKRRSEFAVMAAVGASRWQLLRQMMVEGSILSFAGCLVGCAFAAALLRLFIAISADGMIRLSQARLDLRVVLFAVCTATLAAISTSALPALERPRLSALTAARSGEYVGNRFKQILVAAQIALSLTLSTGASLLVRSLLNLQSEPLGFRPDRIVTASFSLNRMRYDTPQKQDQFYSELEQKLAAIPGVSRLALSDSVPPAGGIRGRPFSNIRIAGHPPLPENGGMVAFRMVTPGYFAALRIPLIAGRDFSEGERADLDSPIILSATLARRMFGAEEAVGQRIDLDADGHWLPIVGVAADVKNSGLAEMPEPEYYRLRSYQSRTLGLGGVAFLETGLDPATSTRWIRQTLASLDRDLPVRIERMESRVNSLSRRQRFLAALLLMFATLGTFIAAIGLYGVLSFLVAQRTREIGVRMAIGATPGNIVVMMVRQAGLWTIYGVVAGLAASIALGQLIKKELYKVSPDDPLSLASVIGILIAVALAASWWPARRAATVDPAVSLRLE